LLSCGSLCRSQAKSCCLAACLEFGMEFGSPLQCNVQRFGRSIHPPTPCRARLRCYHLARLSLWLPSCPATATATTARAGSVTHHSLNHSITRAQLASVCPANRNHQNSFLITDKPSPSNLPLCLDVLKKHGVTDLVRVCHEDDYSTDTIKAAGIDCHVRRGCACARACLHACLPACLRAQCQPSVIVSADHHHHRHADDHVHYPRPPP
jgi:hypothetical protein